MTKFVSPVSPISQVSRVLQISEISFRRIWVLLVNTVQKEYYNRSLIFLFVFTLLVIYLDHRLFNFLNNSFSLFSSLSPSPVSSPVVNLVKTKFSVFYVFVSIWSIIISIILGAGIVRSDMSMQVISQILSWPITRAEFLLGRIFGAWSMVLAYYLLMSVFAVVLFAGDTFSSDGWTLLGMCTYLGRMGLAFFYCSLVMIPIITLGVLLSLYFAKAWAGILTSIITALIFNANHTFASKETFMELFDSLSSIGDYFYLAMHYLLPRLGVYLEIGQKIFFSSELSLGYCLVQTVHFIFAYLLLLLLLIYFFRRKEF
ncbi:MAG: hypothetical protein HQK53_06285 [Oligoflexia bacterium]|nr:hypothetical protein [Oligoflexia bacterium]